MSSGFVSGGLSNSEGDNDPWTAAHAKVEEARKPKEEEHDQRSLYDILQANKAKKQEAFEESLKFKNQFKPLDEEDVEYLGSILDNERRVEAIRRRELESQLDDFRKHQSEADKVGLGTTDEINDFGNWSTAKRKRKKEGDDEGNKRKGLGLKLRKMSSGAGAAVGDDKEKNVTAKKEAGRSDETAVEQAPAPQKAAPAKESPPRPTPKQMPAKVPAKAPAKPAGGLSALVAYGSDDED